MRAKCDHHMIRKLFAGLVEHAFYAQVGMCDPRLIDYLVMMLIDFIHVDRLYRMRDTDGKRLENIIEMLRFQEKDAQSGVRIPQRDFHRYIGDFALFWTGVFPEGLQRRSCTPNPDHLIYYVGRGKESYAIASELHDEKSDPPSSLLGRLSTHFEVCAHGLALVRRGWERRDFEGLDDARSLLY